MGYTIRDVQETPNPNARKFVIGEHLSALPLSFRSAEAAGSHALVSRLFAVKGVVGVLLVADFITINKSSDARWADMTPKIKRILMSA